MPKQKKPKKVNAVKAKFAQMREMLKPKGRTTRAAELPREYKGPRPIGRTVKLSALEGTGVVAELGRTNDLSKIKLHLSSSSQEGLYVELTGTVLHPDDNGFQRLFVAGFEEAPEVGVNIGPGGVVEVTLATCCMDEGKSCPANSVTYTITDKKAPARLDKAAHDWLQARRNAPVPAKPQLEGLGKLCLDADSVDSELKGKKEDEHRPLVLADEATSPQRRAAEKESLGYVQAVSWGHK